MLLSMLLGILLAFAAEDTAASLDNSAFQSDEEDDLAVVSNQEQAQAAQVGRLHGACTAHVAQLVSGIEPSQAE